MQQAPGASTLTLLSFNAECIYEAFLQPFLAFQMKATKSNMCTLLATSHFLYDWFYNGSLIKWATPQTSLWLYYIIASIL
jgi:hypothetical protein